MFCLCVSSLAASRQAVAGGGSHCGGWRVAPTPLWCSIRGCAAELTSCCALRSNSRGESETKRASRANPESALRAATEIASAGHRLPRSRVQARHRWCSNIASARPACRAYRPGGASGTPSSARVSVGARERASCSDSPRLFERSAQRVASCAVRPNPEQRRGVAAGDRSSEAPRAVCPAGRLCREAEA